MKKFDRIRHIKEIHASRKALTCQKVDNSIKRLLRSNERINFNSVAKESGVCKATLYNHPDIRKQIETLREQQVQTFTINQSKRDMNESNKDAVIASLKRRIKKLEDDKKELREQLNVAYAVIYKNI